MLDKQISKIPYGNEKVMALPYPIESVRREFTDRHTLQDLYAASSAEGTRVALVGFNEYSKHLVNLCADNIVGFYDPETWKTGISFRGKLVVDANEKLDITHIVVCDPLLAYDFADRVSVLYDDTIKVYVPARFGDKTTSKLDPFVQEQVYKDIFAETRDAPLSMMNREKLCLVMELLRHALRVSGDVIEVGVWQGGSAWYLAKLLAWEKATRKLYLVDPFERISRNPTATMCNDEIARVLRFYPHIEMYIGFANDTKLLSQLADKQFCFLHCDLGYQHAKEMLALLWDRLSPGAPIVFDNYGILEGQPRRMERFFAERGAHVIRLPWSEQGLVFKTVS